MSKSPEAGNAGETFNRQKFEANLEFILTEITQTFAEYHNPSREEQEDLESRFKDQLDKLQRIQSEATDIKSLPDARLQCLVEQAAQLLQEIYAKATEYGYKTSHDRKIEGKIS